YVLCDMCYKNNSMKIIVGLGNPGEKYNNTRHNAGFIALDFLAKKENLVWKFDKKFNIDFIKHNDIFFIKPLTFMNNSGQAVALFMNYYKLLPKKIGLIKKKNSDLSQILTVIHDDLDIESGKYKISANSRSAGHRGVQSIIDHLKTKNFRRVRIGIKNNKPKQMPIEKYVLQKFSEEEMGVIDGLIGEIIKIVLTTD
ncbi:aminoacyl-tRNA hydrolase, partial [Candidatus Parcubacteria bacterium]|nr:aminoacyl-tRNA hydrolase [Candidatus Parcubacteria bacterium]